MTLTVEFETPFSTLQTTTVYGNNGLFLNIVFIYGLDLVVN